MGNPEVLVVIPLRRASERLPNKVLADIAGTPMALRTCQRVCRVFDRVPQVRVAAAVDDGELEKVLKASGLKIDIVMTPPELPSGTDRVYQASKILMSQNGLGPRDIKGIINVQGDIPFCGADVLKEMAGILLNSDQEPVEWLTASLVWPKDLPLETESQVKVLLNRKRDAIYFSRLPIPYGRVKLGDFRPELHLGIYAYSLESLTRFCLEPPTAMERLEGLEQLRALYLGLKIHVILTKEKKGESFRGIDVADDLAWAREFAASL